MNFSEFLGIDNPKYIETIIQATNRCNLHCEHCTNLTRVPIKADSWYVWRRQHYDLDPYILSLFCERFRGIGEDDGHMITGGEATSMSLKHLKLLINMLSAYGRRLHIRTNGYGLIELGKEHVSRFAIIYLDNHGINARAIVECQEWLDTFYEGKIVLERMPIHYSLEKARNHPHNRGRCYLWMRTMALHHTGILHPCCNTFWLQVQDNNDLVDKALEKAGWSIHNQDIVEVVKNWRETIPQYVRDQCFGNCWKPDFRLGIPTTITLKPNDRIRRAQCEPPSSDADDGGRNSPPASESTSTSVP